MRSEKRREVNSSLRGGREQDTKPSQGLFIQVST